MAVVAVGGKEGKGTVQQQKEGFCYDKEKGKKICQKNVLPKCGVKKVENGSIYLPKMT